MNQTHTPSVPFAVACNVFTQAARRECANVPKFAATHNGCIRITAVPHHDDANRWLHPDDDLGLRRIAEQVYPVYEDGSYDTVTDEGEIMSSYAHSAMQVAYCMALVAKTNGWTLFSCPDRLWSKKSDDFFKAYTEDHGFARHYGCVCTRIAYEENFEYIPYADIYFCVSGASPKENLQCAYSMSHRAKSIFSNFHIFSTYIDLDNVDNYQL